MSQYFSGDYEYDSYGRDTTYPAKDTHDHWEYCQICSAGAFNAAGDDGYGDDTTCIAAACGEGEYASSGSCEACPADTTNPARDDPTGNDTSCAAVVECAGFDAPMNNYPVGVKKNRALPLKAKLFSVYGGVAQTDADTAPVNCDVYHWYPGIAVSRGRSGSAVAVIGLQEPAALGPRSRAAYRSGDALGHADREIAARNVEKQSPGAYDRRLPGDGLASGCQARTRALETSRLFPEKISKIWIVTYRNVMRRAQWL